MRKGSIVATREDGARLIYDGTQQEPEWPNPLPFAHIEEADGRAAPSFPLLGSLAKGGPWDMQIDAREWQKFWRNIRRP